MDDTVIDQMIDLARAAAEADAPDNISSVTDTGQDHVGQDHVGHDRPLDDPVSGGTARNTPCDGPPSRRPGL